MKKTLVVLMLLGMTVAAQADIIVSEVMAGSKMGFTDPATGKKMHNGDWFEITNTGAAAMTLTGWTWVDNDSGHARIGIPTVTLTAGESIVILEEDEDGYTTDFAAVWNISGVQIITEGDMGEFWGLAKSGDSVNLYDNTNTLISGVTFGSITDGFSYDFVNNHLSQNGVDGAWSVTDTAGTDVASPGVVVPEPLTLSLLALGGLLIRRK